MKKTINWIVYALILLVVSMPIVHAAEISLTYDVNGNLITGDGKYRVYNSLNQLWKVYNGSTNTTLLEEYTYHPVEERVLIKKSYNSSGSLFDTTYYINQNYMQVVNVNGSIYNFTYYYLQGQLVAQDVNGVKTYMHTDHKGNVVAVTNSTGQIIERTSYDPFGAVLSGGRQSRFGYEGKEQDTGDIIPLNGLVSYYSFNDGTNDEVTNNSGSVVNATKTTGIVRDAYYFNGNGTAGKTQGYITIPNSNVLNISGSEITLSVWIKPNLVQGNEQIIISKNSYLQYKIGYVSSGVFRFTLTNTSSITKDLNTPSTYTNTSMWYHIVGTYNGSIMRLYVNGVEVTNTTFAGNIKGSTSNVVIGCFASSLDRCFNGTIDEIGIWNRAISPSEIKSLYNNARNYDTNPSTDFNFRMLSTTTGQFQQPDNIIDSYSSQDLNRFTFEKNNPYKYTDPTGHWAASLGYERSGVFYGYTLGGEAGLAVSYDEYYGFQFGTYQAGSATGALGVEGKVTGKLTYSKDAKSIRDLGGADLTYGGSACYYACLGYEKSSSLSGGSNSQTFIAGAGMGLEGHGGGQYTAVQKLVSHKTRKVNGLKYNLGSSYEGVLDETVKAIENGETAGQLLKRLRENKPPVFVNPVDKKKT